MRQLDLNKLYYFYMVAKQGSIKNASKVLHLTQPTISTQIKQLEDELGSDLFTRKHRKLELTTRGVSTLKKAEKIFEISNQIINEENSEKKERLEITIGALNFLSNSFLYEFSLDLWNNKDIKLNVIHGNLKELSNLLDHGKIDMLLTDGPYKRTRRYQEISIGSDTLIAVTGSKSSNEKKHFPQSLSHLNYLSYHSSSRLQDEINFYFEQNNLKPDVVGYVDDLNLIRLITEQSKCFSIIPSRSVKASIKNGKLVKLGTISGIEHKIWLVYSKTSVKKPTIRHIVKTYLKRK